MKKAIFIASAIFLVGSLVGVGILLYHNIEKDKRLSSLTSELNQSDSQLTQANSQLSQVNSQLSKATSDLAERDTAIASLKSSLNTTNQKYQDAYRRANEATCAETIPTDQVASVSTNQSLSDPIIRAMEAEYGKPFVSSSFAPVWSNSKTAIFTARNANNETDKVVATWDLNTGRLAGIYDMGQGCFYFLP